MLALLRVVRLAVVAAVIVEGFRLVTQSGLTGFAGSIQNDGYAMSGGCLILLGGVVAGYLAAKEQQKK